MSRLKVAVVGTGALGQHHARILAGDPSVELVAVVDANLARAEEVAARVETRAIEHHRDILDQVDAAVIAVPTAAHAAVARDFIERGVAILVEKPLTSDLKEGEQLVQLAEQNGTLLQVGHVERFNPATQVATRLTGPPKYIRAERLSPFAFRSMDIGVVHDLLIHDLDLVLDLVRAPVARVEAFGMSILGEHEDSVQARLVFQNGCIADLTANRVSPIVSRKSQIWSASGCVDVDFQTRQVVHYRPSEELLYGKSPLTRARQPDADIQQLKSEMFGRYIKVDTPPVPDTDALTEELKHFVDCVRRKRPPLVDGRVALRALIVANRILESVARHKWDGEADGAIGPFLQPAVPRKMAG